ncbi:hypothetical protein KMZ32_15505 [Phycicoccus sp. MAQZ13P-2]|nr:hypothetical protein [Phycicoccus mangrovi]MBT9257028.1 hypothetical protein [Phycicoccus mangrovi]MBT9275482.1 hypothetical protein [Phycicoccus mangrovi]
MKDSIITVVVGAVLAGLASFGLFTAATPEPNTQQVTMYTYGDQTP